MAQAELFDNKPAVSVGIVASVVASLFGRRAEAKREAKAVAARKTDKRDANYLADLGMEVGF